MDIEYLPRAGNAPRLDGVVMVGGARSPHGTELPVPRLNKPGAVHRPALQYGRRTVPDPIDIEPRQAFVEHRRFQAGGFPVLAAIERYIDLYDTAAARPGTAADVIEPLVQQRRAAGRRRNHGFAFLDGRVLANLAAGQ